MCSYTLPMLIRGWHTTRVKGKYANSNPSFSCSLLKWLSLQCAIHRIAIMIAQSLSCCVVALKSNLIKHKFKLRGCERSRRWYDAANLLKGDQCVVCVCVCVCVCGGGGGGGGSVSVGVLFFLCLPVLERKCYPDQKQWVFFFYSFLIWSKSFLNTICNIIFQM